MCEGASASSEAYFSRPAIPAVSPPELGPALAVNSTHIVTVGPSAFSSLEVATERWADRARPTSGSVHARSSYAADGVRYVFATGDASDSDSDKAFPLSAFDTKTGKWVLLAKGKARTDDPNLGSRFGHSSVVLRDCERKTDTAGRKAPERCLVAFGGAWLRYADGKWSPSGFLKSDTRVARLGLEADASKDLSEAIPASTTNVSVDSMYAWDMPGRTIEVRPSPRVDAAASPTADSSGMVLFGGLGGTSETKNAQVLDDLWHLESRPPEGMVDLIHEDGGKNIRMSSSGQGWGGSGAYAKDGNYNTRFQLWINGGWRQYCSHSNNANEPWLRYDLGGRRSNIAEIRLWLREDCCTTRTRGTVVLVSSEASYDNAKKAGKHFKCGVELKEYQTRPKLKCASGTFGRYVFVANVKQQILSVCEAEVYQQQLWRWSAVSDVENAALGAATWANLPAWYQGPPANVLRDGRFAVDGLDDSSNRVNPCAELRSGSNPLLAIDLGRRRHVRSLRVVERNDCCGSRMDGMELYIGDSKTDHTRNTKCREVPRTFSGAVTVSCDAHGRYAQVRVPGNNKILQVCEVEVMAKKDGWPLPRHRASMTSFRGTAIVFGGLGPGQAVRSDVHALDLRSMTWLTGADQFKTLGSSPSARSLAHLTSVGQNTVWMLGGMLADGASSREVWKLGFSPCEDIHDPASRIDRSNTRSLAGVTYVSCKTGSVLAVDADKGGNALLCGLDGRIVGVQPACRGAVPGAPAKPSVSGITGTTGAVNVSFAEPSSVGAGAIVKYRVQATLPPYVYSFAGKTKADVEKDWAFKPGSNGASSGNDFSVSGDGKLILTSTASRDCWHGRGQCPALVHPWPEGHAYPTRGGSIVAETHVRMIATGENKAAGLGVWWDDGANDATRPSGQRNRMDVMFLIAAAGGDDINIRVDRMAGNGYFYRAYFGSLPLPTREATLQIRLKGNQYQFFYRQTGDTDFIKVAEFAWSSSYYADRIRTDLSNGIPMSFALMQKSWSTGGGQLVEFDYFRTSSLDCGLTPGVEREVPPRATGSAAVSGFAELEHLAPGKNYQFRVAAANADGYGPWSASSDAAQPTAAAAPTIRKLTSYGMKGGQKCISSGRGYAFATDGRTGQRWSDVSCTHSCSTRGSWMYLDFERRVAVQSVRLWMRRENTFRNSYSRIRVGDSIANDMMDQTLCRSVPPNFYGPSTFTCPSVLEGRYVSVAVPEWASQPLQVCELEVYGYYLDSCPDRSSTTTYHDGDPVNAAPCRGDVVGSECELVCNTQARSVELMGGETKAKCDASGKWTSEPPLCEQTCSPLGLPAGVRSCRQRVVSTDFSTPRHLSQFASTEPLVHDRDTTWRVADGLLHAVTAGGAACAENGVALKTLVSGVESLTGLVRIETSVRTANTAGVIFRAVDNRNFLRFLLDMAAQEFRLERVLSGAGKVLASGRFPVPVEASRFHDIEIRTVGDTVSIRVDSVLFTRAKESLLAGGSSGLVSYSSAQFDSFSIESGCDENGCTKSVQGGQCSMTCRPGWDQLGNSTRTCRPGGLDWDNGGSDPYVCRIRPPAVGNYVLSIPENSARNVPVGEPIQGLLEDDLEQLAYKIEPGSDASSVFAVDLCSGQIKVVNSFALDYETRKRFDIQVRVYVADHPYAFSLSNVTVIVTNVNEPPVLPSRRMAVREHPAAGVVVGFVNATDPEGDELRYTVEIDESAGALQVDAAGSQGRVTTTAIAGKGLNFESRTMYTLIVSVAEASTTDGFAVTGAVEVEVTDANDPPVIARDQILTVDETAATVGTAFSPAVTTSDEDTGSFASEVTISLVSPVGLAEYSTAGAATVALGLRAGQSDSAGVPLRVFAPTSDGSNSASSELIVGFAPNTSTLQLARLPTRVGSAYGKDLGQAFFLKDIACREAYAVKVHAADAHGGTDEAWLPVIVRANQSTDPVVESVSAEASAMKTEGGETVTFTGKNFATGSVAGWYEKRDDLGRVTRSYNASCSIVSPTTITCVTAPGVGSGLSWHLFRTSGSAVVRVRSLAPLVGSYAAPSVANVTGGASLPTSGGAMLEFQGENFGPPGVPVSVTYGPQGASSSCVDTGARSPGGGHSRLVCRTTEGAGANLEWTISVGGVSLSRSELAAGSEGASLPTLSHAPAIVSAVKFASSGLPASGLDTAGGQQLRIEGSDFGPAWVTESSGLLKVRFAGAGGSERALSGCVKSAGQATHTTVTCPSASWVGAGHAVSVEVSAVPSQVNESNSDALISYLPPVLTSVTGPGARGGKTEGGQEVILRGSHMGPDDSQIDEVRYGPAADAAAGRFPYAAKSCSVVSVSPSVVRCLSDEGTGKNHSWRMSVASQTSPTLHAATFYGPPVISQFTGAGADGADTRGGQSVVLSGVNFGPLSVNTRGLLQASYRAMLKGGPAPEARFTPAQCQVTQPHEQITCQTDAGAGTELEWSLTVDGLVSATPTTAYARPTITSATYKATGAAVLAANVDGGETLHVDGDAFGPPSFAFNANVTGPMVQGITYGVTGTEYTPRSFRVVSHGRMEVVLAPGSGSNLRFQVRVADQESPRSDATISFAPPEVVSVRLADGSAAVLATRLGENSLPTLALGVRNLPLRDPQTDIYVVIGNNEGAFALYPRKPNADTACVAATGVCTLDVTMPATGLGKNLAVRVGTARAGGAEAAAASLIAQPDPQALVSVDGVSNFVFAGNPATDTVLSYADPTIDYLSAKVADHLAAGGASAPCPFTGGDPVWQCDDTGVVQVAIIGRNFGSSTAEAARPDGVLRIAEMKISLPTGNTIYVGSEAVFVKSWSHERIVVLTRMRSATLRVRLVSTRWDGTTDTQMAEASYAEMAPQISALQGADAPFPTVGGGDQNPIGLVVTELTDPDVRVKVGGTLANLTLDNGDGTFSAIGDNGDGSLRAIINSNIVTRPDTSTTPFSYKLYVIVPPGQGVDVPVVVERGNAPSDIVTISYRRPSLAGLQVVAGRGLPSDTALDAASPGAELRLPTAGGSVLQLTGSDFGTCPTVVLADSHVYSCASLAPGTRVAECPGTEGSHSCLRLTTPSGQGAGPPGQTAETYSVRVQHGSSGAPSPQRPAVRYLLPTASAVMAQSLPTRGGLRIAVSGMDFGVGRGGINDTSAGFLVEIGEDAPSPAAWQPCTSALRVSHTMLTCVLPEGGGRNLGVRVTVAGQTRAVGSLLSYDRPVVSGIRVEVAPSRGGGGFGGGAQTQRRIETASVGGPGDFRVRGPVAGGFTVVLTGMNFGRGTGMTCVRLAWKSRSLQAPLSCNGVEDSLGEGEVSASRLVSVDHERIELVAPPGMGRKEVLVDVFGQQSDGALSPELHHDDPLITWGPWPSSGSTEGGSEVRVYGANFGTRPQNETRDGVPYESVPYSAGSSSSSLPIPNTHFVRVRFHTACLTDALTAGGARPRLADLDSCYPVAPEFRSVELTRHRDNEIRFIAPPGIGTNRSVVVEVLDSLSGEVYGSAPVYFSYDRPEITGANPLVVRFEDATGGSRLIDILGNNFGNAERAVVDQWTEDELRLDAAVGGVPCAQKRRRREQGNTILSCSLEPSVAVGAQNVSIYIAGQPGFLDVVPEASALKIVCERDFFGQPGEMCMACPGGAKCFGYRCFEHSCPNRCAPCFNGTEQLAGAGVPAICEDPSICPAECGLQTCLGSATAQVPCIAKRCVHSQPRPLAGFFNLNSTDRFNVDMGGECPPSSVIPGRDVCIAPCSPAEACVGDNMCAVGYRSAPPFFRCSSCELGFYRRAGACVKCPDSPELLIVAFVVLAVCAAGAGYLLNQKGIDVALIQIGVDYMQVLAIFASARIAWPPLVKDIFHIMSAFNLNLEITAPECLVPDIAFVTKWLLMMAIPVGCCVFLLVAFVAGFCWRRFAKRMSVAVSLQVGDKILAGYVILLYFLYLQITKQILDIFNCVPTSPPDGRLYLQAVFEPCDQPGGVRETLLVPAIIALGVYSVGYPLFAAYVVRRNIKLIMMDQLLRCYGFGHHPKKFTTANGPEERAWRFRRAYNRLFYAFKPDFYMWILVLLGWKFLIAIAALMFADAPDFQMAFVLFVLFVNYTLQVYFSPYMSRNRYKSVAAAFLKRADEELTAFKMGGKARGALSSDPSRDRPLRVQVADDFKTVCRDNSNTLGVAAGFTSESASASVVQAAEVRDEDVMGVLRSGFFDYNVVATTLMASATLVTLGGIMFESGRLNLEGAEASRDAITYVVLIIIFASLTYFMIVFGFEMFYACNQEGFVRRAKQKAQTGEGGGRTVEDQERLEREGVGVKMVMSNPMLKKGAASSSSSSDSAEKGLLAGEAGSAPAPESQGAAMRKLLSDLPTEPPSREAWQAIKERLELTAADVGKLVETNQDLRRMSRTALSPMLSAAGGAKGKSSRRSFVASRSSGGKSGRSNKLRAVKAPAAGAAAAAGAAVVAGTVDTDGGGSKAE